MKTDILSKTGIITKVEAIVKDKNGRQISYNVGKNTITKGDPLTKNNGLVWMLIKIFGKASSYYDETVNIDMMQLGTGTPTDNHLGTPITNTLHLFDGFDFVDETNWELSPKMKATHTWTFASGQSGISEVGLIADATEQYLIAYQSFTPAISIPAGGTLTINWAMQLAY